MYSEEGVLDRVQLAPELLKAKTDAEEELTKLQWAIRGVAGKMPEAEQQQFMLDVTNAITHAAAQVCSQHAREASQWQHTSAHA